MTDKWIEFCVTFLEENMLLKVTLIEVVTEDEEEESLERKIAETTIKVRPWHLKNPAGLGSKINKTKFKMLSSYQKNRQIKDLLVGAAVEWSREWYSIRDGETDDFIAEMIERQKNKKSAKVLPFKADK